MHIYRGIGVERKVGGGGGGHLVVDRTVGRGILSFMRGPEDGDQAFKTIKQKKVIWV